MLTEEMKLISVDDHLVEHPTVWEDRLPKAMRQAGPRVVGGDGPQTWEFESQNAGGSGLSAVAGKPWEKRSSDPERFEDMRPGCWQPKARLEDMAIDGVWAQLLFPTMPGFGGRKFIQAKDKKLALACVKAYNNFVVEEWTSTAPDRLLALAILPLWDVEETVREIERVASMGHRAFTIPDNPTHVDLPSFWRSDWDPIWSALEAVDLPMCLHFGSSGLVGEAKTISKDAPQAVSTAVHPSMLFYALAELVMSEVLVKHPDLKVMYSESGIGWVPYAMQRLDQVWEHYRYYNLKPALNLDTRPSDLIRRNVYWCFIDDPFGLEAADYIGEDRLMWESDYPHADSLWPNSRANAERVMKDTPDDLVRAITSENAKRVLKLS